MPYVQRDGDGNINGAFALPQPGRAEEFVADDAAEMIAFNEKAAAALDGDKQT